MPIPNPSPASEAVARRDAQLHLIAAIEGLALGGADLKRLAKARPLPTQQLLFREHVDSLDWRALVTTANYVIEDWKKINRLDLSPHRAMYWRAKPEFAIVHSMDQRTTTTHLYFRAVFVD